MVFTTAMLVQKIVAGVVVDRSKATGKRLVAVGGPYVTTSPMMWLKRITCSLARPKNLPCLSLCNDLASGAMPEANLSGRRAASKRSALTPVPHFQFGRPQEYSSMSLQKIPRGCPFSSNDFATSSEYIRPGPADEK